MEAGLLTATSIVTWRKGDRTTGLREYDDNHAFQHRLYSNCYYFKYTASCEIQANLSSSFAHCIKYVPFDKDVKNIVCCG